MSQLPPSADNTRYVFITGGVVSSLGKGVCAAAIGALLQSSGMRIALRKLDPYLNVDPGTMSPYQHGEVFITDDGAETDLDLGHYERFTNLSCRRYDNITAGHIYAALIEKERRGDYLGKTVQVIPHVTDMIKEFITYQPHPLDMIICEIGGTVGDIESLPFLEAIRQLRNETGYERSLFIHLTLLPWIDAADELKTKPTQHSVKELQSVGIQPDILLCRTNKALTEDACAKIALFCNVRQDHVIAAPDVESIYNVPLGYHEQRLDNIILNHLALGEHEEKIDLTPWHALQRRLAHPKKHVDIAVIGKYTHRRDSYKSLTEALTHGGIAHDSRITIKWVDADTIQTSGAEHLFALFDGVGGILVPGGFGERGIMGKIRAIEYARIHKIPFLGICLGMQMAVVEFARHVVGLKEAHSTEFDTECQEPVIGLLDEWTDEQGESREAFEKKHMGGTMRRGAYECILTEKSLAHTIYQTSTIKERHRHRFELNMRYKDALEQAGMVISGLSPDGTLPEVIELRDHPWFVGVQFHPELTSRPLAPHPLFAQFINASLRHTLLL